jgi:hypothetical protein
MKGERHDQTGEKITGGVMTKSGVMQKRGNENGE